MCNEDILRLLPDNQICVLEVNPVTASSSCENPGIIEQMLITDKKVTYFIRGTALTFLQASDTINIRWNGIYKLLIRDDELWFMKYQETHDYLCKTPEPMKHSKEQHYIRW